MPRVHITQAQKDRASAKSRIRRVIKGRLARLDIPQHEIAEQMGLTQSGFSRALTTSSWSIFQLLLMDKVLHFTAEDISEIFGR